jgi:hypothetical protein
MSVRIQAQEGSRLSRLTVPFAIRSLTANSFCLAKNILWLLLILGIFITHFALQEVNKVLTFTC